MSASSGQAKNQSMDVFEIRPGKLRHLILRVLPAGDMANTMCKLFLVFYKKKFHMSYFVSWIPRALASFLSLSVIPFFSYSSKRAGTIPIVNMLFTSYKNPSSSTCASVNKKSTGPSVNNPNSIFKSSLNYFSL